MKFTVHITADKTTLSPDAYASLCKIYPEGISPGGLVADLPADHPVVAQLVGFLDAQGIPRDATATSKCFGFQMHRTYEDRDFAPVEYLAVFPKEGLWVRKTGRDEQGRSVIVEPVPATLTIASGGSKWGCFVSDRIREAIKAEEFIGPNFRETVIDVQEIDEEELDFEIYGGAVWELESSIVLPKLANVHQFVHYQNEPFNGDYSRPICIIEEPFANAVGEFHYRESELRAVEPFDFARTFEFHNKRSHTLVVSQRFYLFCRDLNLPINWQPVRIDPD